MIRALFAAILVGFFVMASSAQDPYVVVLGIGQDAGVPQMACTSPFCEKAWKDPSLRKMVSSIALVDPRSHKRWIFDATPDLPAQFELLKRKSGDRSNELAGIFLTHAHIGHYTGLMYLGRESMNARAVPVYAMPRMSDFLRKNGPWSQLVDIRNIKLNGLQADRAVKLADDLSVTPFLVPHRDEFSETVGYRIAFRDESIVFIPDIDKWQKWDGDLAETVRANEYLLVDGTFFKDGEIPRPISEVPHPFVTETMEMLKDLPRREKGKVIFTHFNHSNPLVQGDKEARRTVYSKGFAVASEGMILPLGAVEACDETDEP